MLWWKIFGDYRTVVETWWDNIKPYQTLKAVINLGSCSTNGFSETVCLRHLTYFYLRCWYQYFIHPGGQINLVHIIIFNTKRSYVDVVFIIILGIICWVKNCHKLMPKLDNKLVCIQTVLVVLISKGKKKKYCYRIFIMFVLAFIISSWVMRLRPKSLPS